MIFVMIGAIVTFSPLFFIFISVDIFALSIDIKNEEISFDCEGIYTDSSGNKTTSTNKIELSAELELIKNRKFLDWPHDARTLNLWGKSYLRV